MKMMNYMMITLIIITTKAMGFTSLITIKIKLACHKISWLHINNICSLKFYSIVHHTYKPILKIIRG